MFYLENFSFKRCVILNIYLDDSGNLDSGGPLYVWAGFSIQSGETKLLTKLNQIFSTFDITEGHKEKKGFCATYPERKAVFECLLQFPSVRISYAVVDKSLLTRNQTTFERDNPSRNKEQSENFFLTKVLQRLAVPYNNQQKKSVIVNIDGVPHRKDADKRLHEYLTLKVNFPNWNHHFSWSDFIH